MILTDILFLLGFPVLLGGAHFLVRGSGSVALKLGMSELAVGLTVVAFGTCAPELIIALVTALRGSADLAVGNVVGSNVLNVLWILGLTAAITPIDFNVMLNVDIWILAAVTVIFFLFTFTGGRHKIDRLEGATLLLLYGAYLAFVVVRG